MSSLLLITPTRTEARALRKGAPQAQIVRTGMGPRRARRAAAELAAASAAGAAMAPGAGMAPADAVAVAGFGGALDPALRPGEIVVADELLTRSGTRVAQCPGAGLIAGMLRRRGIAARVGPVVSVRSPVLGEARATLHRTGALVADMESAWLAPAAAGRPFVVLRAVSDTAEQELWQPIAAARAIASATRALTAASAVLEQWAAAVAPRRLELSAPRASCAGVERAIEVVERTLDRYGPPVYMRKQIVHNRHVVAELERRGAVCVDELEEVPDGATVVFSAHGVSPEVRAHAARKQLSVVDATCPLVNKVHVEARRFADDGYTIVLIGHEGHEETEGTVGEIPDAVRLIADVDEVDRLEVDDPTRVAYLTQTTLAVDETRAVVDRLRERFPAIVGPRSDDICYATQNRQDGVKALARSCEFVLVIGSRNSSNSNRLVEVAQRDGCPARLIDEESQIDPEWFTGFQRVGVTAGASTPDRIVQRIVQALTVLGPLEVSERRVATETAHFSLPLEVRG
jgi:4-hydroxy-3-methylbut-2-enyl diphosphate reductase